MGGGELLRLLPKSVDNGRREGGGGGGGVG